MVPAAQPAMPPLLVSIRALYAGDRDDRRDDGAESHSIEHVL